MVLYGIYLIIYCIDFKIIFFEIKIKKNKTVTIFFFFCNVEIYIKKN